jgi:two-component system sensor histidine kinase SenX3
MNAVVALVVGVALGVLVGLAVGASRRRSDAAESSASDGASTATPPAAATVSGAPGVADASWTDVLDRLALGVVVRDAQGRTTYRNPAARATSGTHIGLLTDDTLDAVLGEAAAGVSSTRTLELYGPPRMAVVVRATPLPDGMALATIEDVSERRRLDAVRTDFVANISHELKTPVGALAVLAEALADEDDPEVVHRVADRMVNEAHRVARTIDDLMELSRIELGESPVREPVDVAAIVHGALERSRTFAEQRSIDVQVLDQPPRVHVMGDRRQLESALGNLVENAVKYSNPGGSVQIRVRLEGGSVEMMVADHGIGIPNGEHHRIFERFYRVDRARSRDTGGTGLGLSIVRHVATNHGGDVLVSSQEGEGSTFVLRLPLAEPSPQSAPTLPPKDVHS